VRLWTIHPKHLDARGLVALWREALLAQAVLSGGTTGYRHHPQLDRFRAQPDPRGAIAQYLAAVRDEAIARGYGFDGRRIGRCRRVRRIVEHDGQLMYEWTHLKRKLRVRDPARYRRMLTVPRPDAHPLFRIVRGAVRQWERR